MRLIELFTNPEQQIKDIARELNTKLYAPADAIAADTVGDPVILLDLPTTPDRHFFKRLINRQNTQNISPEEVEQALIKMHQTQRTSINRVARSEAPRHRHITMIDPTSGLKIPFVGEKNPRCLTQPNSPYSVCKTAHGLEPKNQLYPKTIYRKDLDHPTGRSQE